jgi:catechol 2,3-dioxygenase-like lactoylglutathione lyase family enzyme
MLKFICPLIVVEDIARSRQFYEQLLEQKVKFDFGQNVTFAGDFAIHEQTHFQSLLGDASQFAVMHKTHNGEVSVHEGPAALAPPRASLDGAPLPSSASPCGHRGPCSVSIDGELICRERLHGELYFETESIETVFQRVQQAGVKFVHVLREQPWGQRVMRLYDPDGHVIEVGEPMEAVVWRFHKQGLAIDGIVTKCSMPQEFVEHVIVTRSQTTPQDTEPAEK